MTTLVFDVHSSIHFQDVRMAMIRIPEVIQKIREVQDLLDADGIQMDLSNFMASDNTHFLKNYRKKEFAGVVIQLGLYDRYKKVQGFPQSLIGVSNSISAVRVLSMEISLEELVRESFRKNSPHKTEEGTAGIPVLTGIQIPKYSLYQRNREGEYLPLGDEKVDLARFLDVLSKDTSIYEVGVSSMGFRGTIEDDLQLSWFWDQLGQEPAAQAN